MWSLSLINSFSFARNVTMTSSLADVASPVIFIFFSPNLFLNLCNHLVYVVNGLVSLVLGDPLLAKFSYRLYAFWRDMLPSVGTHFMLMSFTHNFNAFSILTKHLLYTVAVTLQFEVQQQKLAQISFSFFTNLQMEDSFLLYILANSAYNFFLCLLSQELAHFHLKEALYGFSLAYLNCQLHYSCASGPLLSKIRVTWTQALWYFGSWSDSECLTGRICWTKGWFNSFQVGQCGMAWDFITLLRTRCNLKLWIIYFWNFLFNIFGPWLATVTETEESETTDKPGEWGRGHYCTLCQQKETRETIPVAVCHNSLKPKPTHKSDQNNEFCYLLVQNSPHSVVTTNRTGRATWIQAYLIYLYFLWPWR